MAKPFPQEPFPQGSFQQEPYLEEPSYENERPEPPRDVDSSRAVAEYLGDMIGQLEGMARVARLDLLVYLLSMARFEAETHAGPSRPETRKPRA